MSGPEAEFWDRIYAGDDYRFGDEPNAFLAERASAIPKGGAVLCLGDGEGRNGVWLARRGFRVTSLDQSAVAARKCAALANRFGVELELEVVIGRLPEYPLPEASFDAVALIFPAPATRGAPRGARARDPRAPPGRTRDSRGVHPRSSVGRAVVHLRASACRPPPKGKVAVVTGAASGIGRGMAETFVAAGMKVVLSDIETRALEATTRSLRDAGADVHAVVTDVSKAEQVDDLAKQTLSKYGAVHVLCNNAGIGAMPGDRPGGGASWTSSLDDWRWILGEA